MNPDRWKHVQAVFHEAVALAPDLQRSFVEARCADDPSMASEVLALIEEDARTDSLIDRSVAEVAHHILSQPDSPIQSGDFSPYRLVRLVGEGGMGVVYLAERPDLGSVVAVKILRDATLSPSRRERFLSEQRLLAQLNHPSIARLYDAQALPDGTPWFVMEYVPGTPINDFCRKQESSIPERLSLFLSVCEAVQYAHQRAIIHRDIKPSNILVCDDRSVRLLDFGIAKHIDEVHMMSSQTRTGMRMMTPAYASPEQIRGEPVGIQTDVYALGVVLYELLAGQLPFDLSRSTPAEAETIVANDDPIRPSIRARSNPALSASREFWEDLDVLCLTAMHKDLDRRYSSVESLIRDVHHYLAGEPLEARPDTLTYRTGKFIRRHRTAVSTTAVVLGGVISLITYYTNRLARARDKALSEAARTQRIQRFMIRLFEGDDETAGPADSLRVITLIDRGAHEARALEGEPEVQAELFETLGSLYRKLGKFDEAEGLLQSSLDRRQALHGSGHSAVAESKLALGLLRMDQARLEEAESLVREGHTSIQRTCSPGHPARPKALLALGQVLQTRGRYDESIAVLESAVDLYSASSKDHPELASALGELVNSHFYAGHFDVCEQLNHKVLDLHVQLFGGRHPTVAEDLINLGAVQFERGRYREAEAFYRQALDLNEEWFGASHYRTATNLGMLGRALVYQKRNADALPVLERALVIQEAVNGRNHPRVASALNDLGNAAVAENRYDAAEACFRRMVEIYREAYRDRHYLIGIALSNLANVFSLRGDHETAESVFRDALRMFESELDADHLHTGIARVKLGRVLLNLRRHSEAERELREGYGILTRQTSPSVSWLQAARADLVRVYESLGDAASANRFREEQRKAGGHVL